MARILGYKTETDLHSTMLLLYRWSAPLKRSAQLIYIPLCFYFISISGWKNPRRKINLHSTMLLLYQIQTLINAAAKQFTFHYASTLSKKTQKQVCRKKRFTFHYASTLSPGARRITKEEFDLHSTMLLLYQAVSCKSQSYHFYLHSTMLLLYQAEIPLFYDRGFDLHSTMLLLYPALKIICHTIGIYLHSTMLLLYHGRNPPTYQGLRIYIPLCFYFIQTLSMILICRKCIYIPLCFYFIDDLADSYCIAM